jgi:hypothetical protein
LYSDLIPSHNPRALSSSLRPLLRLRLGRGTVGGEGGLDSPVSWVNQAAAGVNRTAARPSSPTFAAVSLASSTWTCSGTKGTAALDKKNKIGKYQVRPRPRPESLAVGGELGIPEGRSLAQLNTAVAANAGPILLWLDVKESSGALNTSLRAGKTIPDPYLQFAGITITLLVFWMRKAEQLFPTSLLP